MKQRWKLLGTLALVAIAAMPLSAQNAKQKEVKKETAFDRLEKAARQLQQAAKARDLEAVQQIVSRILAEYRSLRGAKGAGVGVKPHVRVIINGKEVKPGDPGFPRIQIVPRKKVLPPNQPNKEPKTGDQVSRKAYGTEWFASIEQAKKAAQQTGKPIFVFHTLGDLFGKL